MNDNKVQQWCKNFEAGCTDFHDAGCQGRKRESTDESFTVPTHYSFRPPVWYSAQVRKSRYWGGNASVPLQLLDVTRLPYLFSGGLFTSPFACLCTPCAVGPAVSAALCSEHVRHHTDVVGDSSGRSYITKQWHNVPLLRTHGIVVSVSDCHPRVRFQTIP